MKAKEYVRPIPATWWLHNIHLVLIMIRELTSLFVAGYAVFLLILIGRANQGWAAFRDTLLCPTAVVFQVICLPFVIYHSVTWFNITPQVIVLFRGEERVGPLLIAGGHYVLWLILSLIILLIAL